MKSLNKAEDVENFKLYGPLTQPFLAKDFIYDKVVAGLKDKQKEVNS